MKPVQQDKLFTPGGGHNGNCFAACVASLLELPLWMVPPFENYFARTDEWWFMRVQTWLGRMFDKHLAQLDGHPAGLEGYYIACGTSPRGVGHAAVYLNGALAHDPHYSGDGIGAVDYVYVLREGRTK